jgi:hypothetical protein
MEDEGDFEENSSEDSNHYNENGARQPSDSKDPKSKLVIIIIC